MTTWLDWRTEPMADRPEISEFIGIEFVTLTCLASDCRWVDHFEQTENYIEDIAEAIAQHQDWHENGMPE